MSAETVYHPDPEINEGIEVDALRAELVDIAAGFPARAWRCPGRDGASCSAVHGRGPLPNGGHRCLRCGYVGTGGVMFVEGDAPEGIVLDA